METKENETLNARIRNKLSPIVHIIELCTLINNGETDVIPKEMLSSAIEEARKSVAFLINVY
jgi:hypothetical protein